MSKVLAVAHIADSRSDFYARREELVREELEALSWLRDEFQPLESGILQSSQDVEEFASQCQQVGAQALIIHLPIWGDPIFSVKLATRLGLPLLLLGNSRPETSSLVGMLGAGGALDQVGLAHTRVFDSSDVSARRVVRAFIRAAETRASLRGQTLGLFGGRSLGILTAVADNAQLLRLFGVDIETIDQLEIVQLGESLPQDEVERQAGWLRQRLGGVTFGGAFNPLAFERQVRSYMATRILSEQHELDFVGVKCQPELSDGYVTQCVAHMLMGSRLDANGEKAISVHACECDTDGALTMQLLHLLSGGLPAGLLDIRWFNVKNGLWTLANCGAIPAGLGATAQDPDGLSSFRLGPHVFGKGGGGSLAGAVSPQHVTLARLCRRNGDYWMAIVPGEVVQADPAEPDRVTPCFPRALVRSAAGADFLARFGSNHIHLVPGDWTEELIAFCRMSAIPWQVWQ